jgi:transposase-like protein
MIPVEAAVAGRGDLVMAVTFQQQTGTVLIHRIRMQIYNQETGQLVFAHEVDGQSRVYTRAQYDRLGAQARAALSPEVIEVYAEYPRLTPDEAQAIVALLELSRG